MRYYTLEELSQIVSTYVQFWASESDYAYPQLSLRDFSTYALDIYPDRPPVLTLDEVYSKYALGINTYFDSSDARDMALPGTSINTAEDLIRYPICCAYTWTSGEPDFCCLTERQTVFDAWGKNMSLQVILIDRIGTTNEKLLAEYEKTYGVKASSAYKVEAVD